MTAAPTMSPAAVAVSQVLRVAAVWGTTVIRLRTLERGESFRLGDDASADLSIPDGLTMSAAPLKAAQGGWLLDAAGAVAGVLMLRGRSEDPALLGRAGAPTPVMPGDYGLIQYGQLAIFFQYTSRPQALRGSRSPELLVLLALFCSATFHGSVFGLLRTLMTPGPLPKPVELSSAEENAARFRVMRAQLEPPPVGQDTEAKDPGGAKSSPRYQGLGEVLEGDTGKEIQNALRSINTTASALGGPEGDLVVGGSAGDGASGKGSADGGAYGAPGEANTAVSTGAPAAQGGLSPEQIRRVVVAHTGALRACYESEAQKTPSLKGGVTVQWAIDRSGAVTAASVASTTLGNPRVEGCVVRQVKSWHFPASLAPTTVAGYPFKFGIGG